MSEATAIIVGAVIGAVGTIIATIISTRINIIGFLFTKTRDIAGEWEGQSYLKPPQTHDYEFILPQTHDLKYTVVIEQRGKKVKAVMQIIEAKGDIPKYTHKYEGEIHGDYFVYKAFSIEPESFRISTALLYISTSGRTMRGFFVANGGSNDASKMFVGYTSMTKK